MEYTRLTWKYTRALYKRVGSNMHAKSEYAYTYGVETHLITIFIRYTLIDW